MMVFMGELGEIKNNNFIGEILLVEGNLLLNFRLFLSWIC